MGLVATLGVIILGHDDSVDGFVMILHRQLVGSNRRQPCRDVARCRQHQRTAAKSQASTREQSKTRKKKGTQVLTRWGAARPSNVSSHMPAFVTQHVFDLASMKLGRDWSKLSSGSESRALESTYAP